MKYLLALALIAVVSALPEPVRLLQPLELAQPDIAPLIIPQDVKIADAPAPVDAVKIVDAPVESTADFAVNFVDVAPEAPVADFAVKIVENADEETPSYIPVDTPVQVKVIDMPLPDSVVLPLDVIVPEAVKVVDAPVENDFSVKFVEQPEQAPIYKQYPDPMWR